MVRSLWDSWYTSYAWSLGNYVITFIDTYICTWMTVHGWNCHSQFVNGLPLRRYSGIKMVADHKEYGGELTEVIYHQPVTGLPHCKSKVGWSNISTMGVFEMFVHSAHRSTNLYRINCYILLMCSAFIHRVRHILSNLIWKAPSKLNCIVLF